MRVSGNLSTADGLALMARAGYRTRIDDARHVFLEFSEGVWRRARVLMRRQNPPEAEVRRDLTAVSGEQEMVLYVVSNASDTLRRLAQQNSQIAVADVAENLVVIDRKIVLTVGFSGGEEPKLRRGRVPWARWAAARVLLARDSPQTQTDVAAAAGVTQAAVSQAFSYFGNEITRTSAGWVSRDPVALFELFMNEYPGPGGLSRYWHGIAAPMLQVEQALGQLEKDTDGFVLVSGDVALDDLLPWRRPSGSVLYLRRGRDLHGFAEVFPSEATLETRVPADETIWRTAAFWSATDLPGPRRYLTVDPMIACWDVAVSGEVDVPEAIGRMRSWLLDRPRSRAW